MNDAERRYWRAERRRRWAEVRLVVEVLAIAAGAIWWMAANLRS